jgi:hypothetical protein
MTLIERVMRVMTHINIGSALALFAWVVWSGWQLASGPVASDRTKAEASSRLSPPRADPATPMRLIPMRAGETLPLCCQLGTGAQEPLGALSGADL